jgi:hypothetical protein
MKTFGGLILLVIAAACEGCATQRTLPSHPVAESGGSFPGYQRVLVDGQERYCYAVRTDTERKAVCATAAQLEAEQQHLARSVQYGSRPLTPNVDAQYAGVQLQQSAADLPGYVGH